MFTRWRRPPTLLQHLQLQSKDCILTRFMTLIATFILATSVLFRPPLDYRVPVSIIVSVAAVMLAVQSLRIGKIAYAVLFVSIVGIFTPFRSHQFSPVLTSILDLLTLSLLGASSTMIRKSRRPVVSSVAPSISGPYGA